MDEHTHTPGPWRVIEWDNRIHVTTPDNGIGTQPAWDVWGTAEHHNGVPREVGQANARLIAVAPELLEALRALEEASRCVDLILDGDRDKQEAWEGEVSDLDRARANAVTVLMRAQGGQ